MSNSLRSEVLDVVRIFLLLEVIIGHALGLVAPNFQNAFAAHEYLYVVMRLFFGFGREAAFLFVFISGYFTADLIFIKKINRDNISRKIKKRAYRLYPIGVIGVVWTAFLDFVGNNYFGLLIYHSNGMNFDIKGHDSYWVFIANILQIQPTLSMTYGSNGPIWTLGYLVQFYFLAATFSLIFRNIYHRTIALLVLIAVIMIKNQEFSMLFTSWICGYGVRNFLQRDLYTIPVWLRGIIYFKNSEILYFGLAVLLWMSGRIFSENISIFMVTCAGIIFLLCVIPKISVNIFLGGKIRRLIYFLEQGSFGAYIFHLPLLFLVFGVLTEKNNTSPNIIPALLFLTIVLSVIVASFFIGYLVQYSIEKIAVNNNHD